MTTIRKPTRRDMAELIEIVTNAYPGMKIVSDEQKKASAERLWKNHITDPEINLYALFRNKAMVGVMRLFDFTMRLYDTYIPVGGLGLVAVDLAHKREHVCLDMCRFYVDHYAKKKAPMLALYPFRPDFYRQMGFGYGAKVNDYHFKAMELPKGPKDHIVTTTEKDFPALNDCYHRICDRTHGLIRRTKTYMSYLNRPGTHIVAYRKGKKIEGYCSFEFRTPNPRNWLDNYILVKELFYEHRDALAELLAYLNSQADQIDYIWYATHDEFLHFIPHDPRSDINVMIDPVGHPVDLQGIGIMYRVIDTPGLFRALKNHTFGGQTCKLKLTIGDTFYPKHAGSYIVHFTDGKATVRKSGAHDVEIKLDVADYSSMIMGVVPFDKLYEYKLAEISDPKYVPVVSKLFASPSKPMCVTQF